MAGVRLCAPALVLLVELSLLPAISSIFMSRRASFPDFHFHPTTRRSFDPNPLALATRCFSLQPDLSETVDLQLSLRFTMPDDASSSQSQSKPDPTGWRKSGKRKLSTSYYPDANIHNFAPVARIMKSALPENAKIAKEAKECMQECVSEFISFITSEGKHAIHAVAFES